MSVFEEKRGGLERDSSTRQSVAGGLLRRIRQYSFKRRKTPLKKEEDEEEEEGPNNKMADNGGRHTLPGPSSSKDPRICIEPRKKRFQPFRVVRKIFRRKSKTSYKEGDEESPNLKSRSTSELLSANCQEERSPVEVPSYAAGLSLSHDSIFAPESRENDPRGREKHFVHSPKRFSVKRFKEELLSKFRPRQDSDDDDAGLPRSPCTSPTTVEVLHQGLIGKSDKFRSSDGSLLSMGSSGTDTEDYGSRNLVFDRQPVNSDPDLNIGSTQLLSNDAARHRIAVRPRRTRATTVNNRRVNQVSTGSSLPTTPEDTEEPVALGKSKSRKVKDEAQTPAVLPKPSAAKRARPDSLQIHAEETAEDAVVPQNSRSKTRAAKQKVEHEIKKFRQRESPEKTPESPTVPNSPEGVVDGPKKDKVRDRAVEGKRSPDAAKPIPRKNVEGRNRPKSLEVRGTDERIVDEPESKSPEAQTAVDVRETRTRSSEELGPERDSGDDLGPKREPKALLRPMSDSGIKHESKVELRPKRDFNEEWRPKREAKVELGPTLESKEESGPKSEPKVVSRLRRDLKTELGPNLEDSGQKQEAKTESGPNLEPKVDLGPKPESAEATTAILTKAVAALPRLPRGTKQETKLPHDLKSDSKESETAIPTKDFAATDDVNKVVIAVAQSVKVQVQSEGLSQMRVSPPNQPRNPAARSHSLRRKSNRIEQLSQNLFGNPQESPEPAAEPRRPAVPASEEPAAITDKSHHHVLYVHAAGGEDNSNREKEDSSEADNNFVVTTTPLRRLPGRITDNRIPAVVLPRAADTKDPGPQEPKPAAEGVTTAVKKPTVKKVEKPQPELVKTTAVDDNAKPRTAKHRTKRQPINQQLSQEDIDQLEEEQQAINSIPREKAAAAVPQEPKTVVEPTARKTSRPSPAKSANPVVDGGSPRRKTIDELDITIVENPRLSPRGAVRHVNSKPEGPTRLPPLEIKPYAPPPSPQKKGKISRGDSDVSTGSSHAETPSPLPQVPKPVLPRKGETKVEPLEMVAVEPLQSSPPVKTPQPLRKTSKVDNAALKDIPSSPKPKDLSGSQKPKDVINTETRSKVENVESGNTVEPVTAKPQEENPPAENEIQKMLRKLSMKRHTSKDKDPAVKEENREEATAEPTTSAKAKDKPRTPSVEAKEFIISVPPLTATGNQVVGNRRTATTEKKVPQNNQPFTATAFQNKMRSASESSKLEEKPQENATTATTKKLVEEKKAVEPSLPSFTTAFQNKKRFAADSSKQDEKPQENTTTTKKLVEDKKEVEPQLPQFSTAFQNKKRFAVDSSKPEEKPQENAATTKKLAEEKKVVESPLPPFAAAFQNKMRFTGDSSKSEEKPHDNTTTTNSSRGKAGEQPQTTDQVEKQPEYSRTLRSLRKVSQPQPQQATGEPSRKEAEMGLRKVSLPQPLVAEIPRLGIQNKEQKIVIEESGASKKTATAESPKRPQSIPLTAESQRQTATSAFNGVGRVAAAGWTVRRVKAESPVSPKESPVAANGDAAKPKAAATAKFSENGGEKATEISPSWMKDLKQKNEMKKQQTTVATELPQTIIIENQGKPSSNRSSKVLDMANTFQHRVTS